ncbi:deoxynucleotidyltransferase terminal-interacting protein 2 [Drosophila takahashii]|uniref:deoxynucleotidyltransferase terminal-interacting protein 2 n=1 Tax=Drosophila takahashii TaxID=29030 RepID=UPI001CF8AB28|nr:deoxynucleotidyltransferase terminal-interacting protein 2 [Drosophila takahashii]
MDSIFLLDTKGNQDIDGDQQQTIAYNRDLLLPEEENDSDGGEQQEGEVKLFGLTLDCNEVLNAVSSQPEKRKLKLKRNALLDQNAGQDVETVREKVEKNLKDSRTALNPALEKTNALPTVGKRQQPNINRVERARTKGKGWFDLPATEVTEEMRNELKIIQMRSVLNPKQFYKKNDLKRMPKYFQIGTVQHSALDHYKEKKSKKSQSLVNELLEDKSFQMFNKRKFNEVIQRTDKYAYRKNMKKMKKLKKNK